MLRFILRSVCLVGCLALFAGVVRGGEAAREKQPAPYAAEMNQKFVSPEADVAAFVRRFESESRDVYVQRGAIVRAVGLKPGDRVADIGAGTGLFTLLFAEQVEPKGTVYAVDIGPAFLKYIEQQAKERKCEPVIKTVLNSAESVGLPAASIDVAFVCDTYHHFEYPERMLASIREALRAGGRLIVIDFDLRPESSDFVKQRARAAKEVYDREIAAGGFAPVEHKDAPKIRDNFFAEYQRTP